MEGKDGAMVGWIAGRMDDRTGEHKTADANRLLTTARFATTDTELLP